MEARRSQTKVAKLTKCLPERVDRSLVCGVFRRPRTVPAWGPGGVGGGTLAAGSGASCVAFSSLRMWIALAVGLRVVPVYVPCSALACVHPGQRTVRMEFRATYGSIFL